jgi:hypothetical protein
VKVLLTPFASAIQVFGMTIYFLAMLIISSRYVRTKAAYFGKV